MNTTEQIKTRRNALKGLLPRSINLNETLLFVQRNGINEQDSAVLLLRCLRAAHAARRH